jgi:hypothetical protein
MSNPIPYCIDCETACGCGDQPDALSDEIERANATAVDAVTDQPDDVVPIKTGPALETYLCVNSITLPARITSGDVVQAIRLPSGTVLIKLGDTLLTTDEAVLIASFVNV